MKKRDFGEAENEIEEPIPREKVGAEIEIKKENNKEAENKRKNKRFVTTIIVFLICLMVLIGVWVTDSILKAKGLQTSDFTSVIIEILKALLFTICGFAFATHWNKE